MMKLRYRFFIFTILNTYVSLIFHAKIQPKISSGSGIEVYFVDLLFLVIWPSWIFLLTQFYNSEILESGHAPCEISEM